MQPQDAPDSLLSGIESVVLDTNVVLALYWFRDARLARLAAAIETGQLRWLATPGMREELAHVLQRLQAAPLAGRMRPPEVDAVCSAPDVLRVFDRWVMPASVPSIGPTPRCTDAADQKFIDLALASRSRWLFSRDRAVLRLRRKILALTGCKVQRPEDWPQ
jgi:predicted nucleic acid-binding protein